LLSIDGLSTLFGYYFKEDTVYSEHYTDNGWRKIRIGSTESEVKTTIGKPLREWTPKSSSMRYMAYSNSPGGTHYRVRLLGIEGGVVRYMGSGFYID
jgi:hypothetical protein